MAENKTQPVRTNPTEYLKSIEPARRREEGLLLLGEMSAWTGLKPVLWGESMIGFGKYHYHYKSGRQGDFFLTGFAPRKAAVSIYIMPGFSEYSDLLGRLGKHKHSVSCLYLTSLDKIDIDVLQELVIRSVADMKRIYPAWSEDAFAKLG